MVLGSLILQQRMGFTDRGLVDQIKQNPYYQFFIGLDAFQHTEPFSRTLLVEWRKRVDLHFIIRANDILCDASPKAFNFRKRKGNTSHGTLIATQICDAKAGRPSKENSCQVGTNFRADEAMAETANESARTIQRYNVAVPIGEYLGMKMNVTFDSFFRKFTLNIKGKLSHEVEIGSDPSGNITRIGNAMESMTKQLEDAIAKLANVEQQLETAKIEVEKPFPQEQELNDKLTRLAELNSLLDMDEKGEDAVDLDEDAPKPEPEKVAEEKAVEAEPVSEPEKSPDEDIPDEEDISDGEELAEMDDAAVISAFKDKTKEMFHELDGMDPDTIEASVSKLVQDIVNDCGLDVTIEDVVVSGSRCRGMETEGSDLDVVLYFGGSEREDTLFNTLHEGGNIIMGGVCLDINPISQEKTGSLSEYLKDVEAHLMEK